MKRKFYAVISIAMLLLGSACKKDKVDFKSTANIYIVNAVAGGGAIKVNPGAGKGFTYKTAADQAFGTGAVYGAFTGSTNIIIVSSADSTQTIFNRTINLQPINTLYLAGQSPNIDTLYRVEKNFPYISQSQATLNPDNSMYIRFINLCPNSTPVKINIRNSLTNEVESLAYKAITDFIKYPALTTTPNYVFEVRSVADNSLIASATVGVSASRFKTLSLILKGAIGSTTTPPSVFQFNYN